MAENRTINIKINQNADKAEQSFKSYNKELGNTKKQYDAVLKSGKPFDQQLEDINRIVKETPLNVRDMNKQIQAYQSIALSAGRETPVGREALKAAAELRDRYVDIQNETKRLADDQKTLEGAMQGVATGVAVYGGIQSAMALSGVESEKLRETLVKLQAAQTLMNSINQVATAFEKESALMLTLKAAKTQAVTAATAAYATVTGTTTGALKLFRLALVSTGIGAIVVGLGLLIANFDKVKKAVSGAIDRFRNLGPVMKALLLPITAIVEGAGLVKDALQALGVLESDEEEARKARAEAQRKRINAEIERETKLFNLRKENYDNEQKAFDRRIALLQAEGKQTGVLEQIKELNAIKQAKRDIEYAKGQIQRIRLLKRRLNGQSEEAKQFEQQIDAFNKAIRDSNQQILDSNNQLKINTINANKEKADSYKKYIDKKEEQRKKDEQRERERLKNLENLENEFQDRIAQIQEENYQNTLSDEERELRAVQDKYFELETLAEGNAEQLNIIEEARLNEENEIKLKYATEAYNNQKALDDKAAADQDAKDKKAKADAKALSDYRVQVAQQSLTAIADIANLFAKGNEKQQKRAFQIQKAVGIAQATINTAQAITKVFAETTDFTPTQSLRIANAVGIGLAGAAQIASIASQQFTGGGDVESPSGAIGGGETVAPQFNVVGESGINQLAQLQQQPVQAYVVSGEVTTGQALDRNRVQNATL